MTVHYAGDLATNTSWGCFTKLLFRWRGSVYKLVWAEYLVFIFCYYVIFFTYRYGMDLDQQIFFEKISHYCEKSWGTIEMSFVLGFFVTSIVSKWWSLYQTIPWPFPVAVFVNANIRGSDEATRLLKRRIMRYCNLALILTFRNISPPFCRRYPTLSHLEKEGWLTSKEKITLKHLENEKGQHPQWLPITWATELAVKALTEEKIHNEFACQMIIDRLDKYRHGCTLLMDYEQSSVPLVYIQVVTIAVYTYFLSGLLGRQWLIRNEKLKDLNLVFPFFTTLHFIFYMGWLKVAESLINPFGNDDDDFELDEIVERRLKVTYMMVDKEEINKKALNSGQHVLAIEHENLGYQVDKEEMEKSEEERMFSPPPKFSDVVTVKI